MHAPTRLIVANWKTYLSHTESIVLLEEHKQVLNEATQKNTQLVICPTFTALPAMHSLLQATMIKLGAQDCSAFDEGSHTGDVAAQSLAEIQCHYCIIGHNERRAYYHESNDIIVKKAQQLFTHNIAPIICIGEDRQTQTFKHIAETLAEQLVPIVELYESYLHIPLCVAYEPAWAIGTGVTPQPTIIAAVGEFVRKLTPHHVTFLYGGSVNERDFKSLEQIKEINGFLIGKASTDMTSLLAILKN